MSFVKKIYKITASSDNAEDIGKAIVEEFKKHFPKSKIDARFATHLGANLRIVFSLVDTTEKLPNRIADNDPAYSVWLINGFDKTGKAGPKIKAEIMRGGTLNVKPPEGSHMAMGSLKLGWRNKTGTPENIIKSFAEFAAKAKKLMVENADNIYGDEKQVAIYKSYLK